MTPMTPGETRRSPTRSSGDPPGGGAVGRQQSYGEDQADEAERDVDQEQPRPREVVEDQAADDRTEDRAERGGQADGGHQPAEVLPVRGLDQERGHQRQHHAAAETLHDPEGDQALDVPRARTQRGADQEQRQRGQPEPLAADPALRPAADRDGDEHGEQVRRAHPLDRADRRVELGAELVDRDAHDRRVEDDGDGAGDQRGSDALELRVERGTGCRCGGLLGHGRLRFRYTTVSWRQSRSLG
jgi:hypothetical protein